MSKEYYYVQGERVNITRREGLIAVQFGYRARPPAKKTNCRIWPRE